MQLLKGKKAKEIRNALGLSQRTVSNETGINNTEISRFENDHLILRNDQVESLISFYREKAQLSGHNLADFLEEKEAGTDTSAEAEAQSQKAENLETNKVPGSKDSVIPVAPAPGKQMPVSGQNHLDGIVVPADMDPELAESLMSEYQANKEKIRQILNAPAPRKFFGLDIDMEALLVNILIPMAENFAIVEQIHGHEPITKWETVDDLDIHRDRRIVTYKDAVQHLFTTSNKA